MKPKDPRSYLWANIATLLGDDATASIDAIQRRLKIGRGSVQRLKEGGVSVGIDILTQIAERLGVEVWQLLVPGLDPDKLPAIEGASRHSIESPFSPQLLAAARRANADDRRRAENVARSALEMDPLPRVEKSAAA